MTLASAQESRSAGKGHYNRRWGRSALDQRTDSGSARVTLALSGGGARGFAHIGVLRAFEERGIAIAGIAGTSMGAVVGGLYAVGYSPDEIEDIAANTDLSTLFANAPRRRALFLTQREKIDQALITLRFSSFKPVIPTELTAGQRVSEVLSRLTMRQSYRADNDFTGLPTPFLASATDMETGQAITLERGNLAESMRASMAFPLALSAVELDGRLLTDGGMTRPIPVDLARSLLDGEGYVVAVNTTKDLQGRDKITDAFEVANQVTTIMSRRELLEQLDSADFVITPPVRSLDGADFRRLGEISRLGYDAAAEVIDAILQGHRQRRASRSLGFTSVVLGADRRLIEALAEPLLSNAGRVSAAYLDSLLAERWKRGDLLTLSARTVRPGAGSDTKLIVEAVGIPETEWLTLRVINDEASAPDSVHQSLSARLRGLGKLDVDSLAAWTVELYREM
ncbi:MAG: patatin-like phospholipase family protein, partial [Candidatus Zixiibacteriota bacterium]